MYTMKQTCKEVGITYETLRFYCDEGLIPNVKRDKNNYRCFDDENINIIKGLICLKKCGMSIKDMKKYMSLCEKGTSSINERKEILDNQSEMLIKKMEEIKESLEYIKNKKEYYDEILNGKIKHSTNFFKQK